MVQASITITYRYHYIPIHLERRPSNNAIKPDMLIIDKEGKKISLIEGTKCAPDCIAKREKEKQDKHSEMRKSLERLNRGYEIDQINVVFDFLGCYSSNWSVKSRDYVKERMRQN